MCIPIIDLPIFNLFQLDLSLNLQLPIEHMYALLNKNKVLKIMVP